MPDRRTFLGGTGLAAAAAALPGGTARTAAAANLPLLQAGGTPWWRGQPHAHANPERFGPYQHLPRSTPYDVIEWYATHNYNFAVAQIGLNVRTPTAGLSSLFDLPGQFLVWPGEEVSRIPDGLAPDGVAAKDRICDTLALFTTEAVDQAAIPDTGTTVRIYSAEREAIEAAGGIASLAHPRLTHVAGVEEMIKTRPARGVSFFEVGTPNPASTTSAGVGDPPPSSCGTPCCPPGRSCTPRPGMTGSRRSRSTSCGRGRVAGCPARRSSWFAPRSCRWRR